MLRKPARRKAVSIEPNKNIWINHGVNTVSIREKKRAGMSAVPITICFWEVVMGFYLY